MFWGLVLEPSKKYTQKVDQTFHISQAALDLKSSDIEAIQLVVEYENSNFILATLCKRANIFQVPLDLIFKTGDQVSFRTIGNGKVHLSGYHVLDDIDSMLNGEDESDLEELREIEEKKGKRKKSNLKSKNNKKIKLNEEESGEDDDNNNDDDDNDDADADADADDDDDDDDNDDDDDDDDDEGDDNDESVASKKKSSSILSSNDDIDHDDDDDDDDEDDDVDDNEDDDDDDDDEDDDEDDVDSDEDIDMKEEMLFDGDEVDIKTSKSQNKKNIQTPNGLPKSLKNKDKLNKNKKQTIGQLGKTPPSENKLEKKEKQMKNTNNQGPPQRKNQDDNKSGNKTPKSPKGDGSPQKKVLEGGVISEDIKVGDGPIAKPGKMVNVYYIGTLGSTKKQFDSVQQGPGFKFRLGRNEVIKGWDIGVNGMKVGGKRRLVIPAHLAYGSKGSPPVIPPNSTLIFTVELRGLS